MKHPAFFPLRMARDWTIEAAESCSEELALVRPSGFNNSFLWHVGHILTVAERMLFTVPVSSPQLPQSFGRWFESGTSPADWDDDVPRLATLISMLREQQARIADIAPDLVDLRLLRPFYGFSCLRDCAGFAAVHEALHVGKMEEMLRLIRFRP